MVIKKRNKIMNKYKIEFTQQIYRKDFVEIDAESEEEAEELFYNDLEVNVSLSDNIYNDVMETEVSKIKFICEIDEEEEE